MKQQVFFILKHVIFECDKKENWKKLGTVRHLL